ncbi:MAG TPA: J domain-containing protein [Pyrinomonadaceae bacterium]|nr:J domain-containing protein [Pyrinomonadaceae bacterium]
MITDLSKAYELLGVKPGVSSGELKAAHRDLAKVWHPDRFVHDPRLQEKAQEKLKEINEAYELLVSGKTPRRAPPPPRAAAETVYTAPVVSVERRSAPRGGSSYKSALVVLLFLAVFAVTTKVLLDRRKPAQPQVEAEAVPVEVATRPDANTRTEATHKPNRAESTVEEQPAVASDTTTSTAPTPALATVTVLIDPESGLLAKPDCPVRSRMTYPSGSQPSAYCNINHAPPPKESKIKSLKEKILH